MDVAQKIPVCVWETLRDFTSNGFSACEESETSPYSIVSMGSSLASFFGVKKEEETPDVWECGRADSGQ